MIYHVNGRNSQSLKEASGTFRREHNRENNWYPALLASSVLIFAVVYGIRPMVSYQVLKFGGSSFDIGLVASAFAASSLVIAIPAGRWVDRLGGFAFALVGALFLTISVILLIPAKGIGILAVSQLFLGCGHMLSVVALQTILTTRSPDDRAANRIGTYTVANSVGQLLGPLIASILVGNSFSGNSFVSQGIQPAEASGMIAIYIVFAGLSMVAILTTFILPKGRLAPNRLGEATVKNESTAFTEMRQVLALPAMVPAMVTSLTVLSSVDILTAYLPLYGEQRRLSVSWITLLLSVRAGFSILSRLSMGVIIHKFGTPHVLIASLVIPALMLTLIPWLHSLWLLLLAMALAGFGLGIGQPLTMAWVAQIAPPEQRGTALSIRLSGNRLGQLVAPLLFAGIAHTAGVGPIFWGLGVLLGGSAAFSLFFSNRSKSFARRSASM